MADMEWLFETTLLYPRRSIAVILTCFVVVACFLWWAVVWQNPRHVFEDMLANSLTTSSVTRRAAAASGNQRIEQSVRLDMGNTNAADWLVTATQASSTVTTESIGTPQTGYIRYVDISSTLKSKNGQAFDFSSVLNIWGKSDGVTDTSLNELFSESLLDISSAPIPPIGNLPAAQRANILAYINDENIFTPDYTKVKRETINGRAVYTYPVTVQLGAYVRMMQAFAHDLGLTSLDTIDPSQYSTVAPIAITISVDRASHELARVTYGGTGFSQTYVDWGLVTPITLPRTAITTTELQRRVDALDAQKS